MEDIDMPNKKISSHDQVAVEENKEVGKHDSQLKDTIDDLFRKQKEQYGHLHFADEKYHRAVVNSLLSIKNPKIKP